MWARQLCLLLLVVGHTEAYYEMEGNYYDYENEDPTTAFTTPAENDYLTRHRRRNPTNSARSLSPEKVPGLMGALKKVLPQHALEELFSSTFSTGSDTSTTWYTVKDILSDILGNLSLKDDATDNEETQTQEKTITAQHWKNFYKFNNDPSTEIILRKSNEASKTTTLLTDVENVSQLELRTTDAEILYLEDDMSDAKETTKVEIVPRLDVKIDAHQSTEAEIVYQEDYKTNTEESTTDEKMYKEEKNVTETLSLENKVILRDGDDPPGGDPPGGDPPGGDPPGGDPPGGDPPDENYNQCMESKEKEGIDKETANEECKHLSTPTTPTTTTTTTTPPTPSTELTTPYYHGFKDPMTNILIDPKLFFDLKDQLEQTMPERLFKMLYSYYYPDQKPIEASDVWLDPMTNKTLGEEQIKETKELLKGFIPKSDYFKLFPTTRKPPRKLKRSSSTTTVSKTSRAIRYKTKTSPKPTKKLDIPKLLAILANLTQDYSNNLMAALNQSLQSFTIPTCPTYTTTQEPPTTTITTTTSAYANLTGTIMGKCFVCGLTDVMMPRNAHCADAFQSDFIPLVPVNPQSRGSIAKFRKYCRWMNIPKYFINASESKSMWGRWTGGCSVRWIDVSGIYTQRTCRNRHRAVMGRHWASKRMAKLEMALQHIDNGCVQSPMSSLVPLSRGISLYARFHACVCTGNWCNDAVPTRQWTLLSFTLPLLPIFLFNT